MRYLESHAGGSHKRSYTAVGWHAQIRQLTGHSRGSAAADAVGLDPTARTLRGWLAGSEPSKANQGKIHAAYRRLAADFPSSVKSGVQQITGEVTIDGDTRQRGDGNNATLKIGMGNGGDWSRIEDAWNAGTLTEAELGEWYVKDVCHADLIGVSSDSIEFTGSGYSIT